MRQILKDGGVYAFVDRYGDICVSHNPDSTAEDRRDLVWLCVGEAERTPEYVKDFCSKLEAAMLSTLAAKADTVPPPAPEAKTGLTVFKGFQSFHYPTAVYYEVDDNGTLSLFKTDIAEDVVAVFAPGSWERLEEVLP